MSLLSGCSPTAIKPPNTASQALTPAPRLTATTPVKAASKRSVDPFAAYAAQTADALLDNTEVTPLNNAPDDTPKDLEFSQLGNKVGETLSESFFKGRYNRSRARSPENMDTWRSRPDIANPGPDIANFPNSAFTLPEGHAYVELAPFNYSGRAQGSPAQYYTQFLLRYGATDNIELRLMGNGLTWEDGVKGNASTGFSPLQFDTKIHFWVEKSEYFIPAVGFETYIQTPWLANPTLNQGLQPYFALLFDQSLPWGIDLEYNLGTARTQTPAAANVWELIFEWALQKDILDDDVAVFVHGSYSNWSQSLPVSSPPSLNNPASMTTNLIGGGLLWTVNNRLALFGQVSAPTTRYTPAINSMLGFAIAF